MKLAGNAAEDFCLKPDKNRRLILIHGREDAVIDDAFSELTAFYSKQKPSPEIVRVFEDGLKSTETLLEDISADSLFGDPKLFLITAKAETQTVKLLSLIDVPAPAENRVIIRAPNLTPKSKTRKAFEASKDAVVLHFYEQSGDSLAKALMTRFKEDKIEIETDAISRLIEISGSDPRLAKLEAEKLVLYAQDVDRPLNRDDVSALAPIQGDMTLEVAIEAAFNGRIAECHAALDRAFAAGGSAIGGLRMVQKKISRVASAHEFSSSGLSSQEIGRKLKPPVFDKEWSSFRQRMSVFSENRALGILAQIYEVERICKTAGAPAESALRSLLVRIATMARPTRR